MVAANRLWTSLDEPSRKGHDEWPSPESAVLASPRRRRLGRVSWPGHWRVVFAVSLGLAACQPLRGADAPTWAPGAREAYDLARADYQSLNLAAAEEHVQAALRIEPERKDSRLLGAQVALARLEFEHALELLSGQEGITSQALRARALWYSGQVSAAAEELDRLLKQPEGADDWARGIARLAREGMGREPYRISGAQVAAVEMPSIPLPVLLVPVELNGEPVLALVATGSPEVVLDVKDATPSWVTLRFGGRMEVKDVPALGRDLSAVSKQIGAPVRLLLGANLLRRVHATFDFYGGQFVARNYAPPPPPSGVELPLHYIRGGGAVMSAPLKRAADAPAAQSSGVAAADGQKEADAPSSATFLVDSSVLYPLALSDQTWGKIGVATDSLRQIQGGTTPGQPALRQGVVPGLVLGAFNLPDIPAVAGLPIGELAQGSGIAVDGVIGSALLAEFRVTLAAEGRSLWLEPGPEPLPSLLSNASTP